MNIETSYRPPRTKELKDEGYYSQYVSYQCTDEIIAHLTSYGSPFATITNQYLSMHKQSLAHPVRMAISIYAYGLNNTNQFGGKLDNALYQSAIRLIRHIIIRTKKRYQLDRLLLFNNKDFISLADVIYMSCKLDAKLIADRVNGVKYIPSNDSWYNKIKSNP